MDWLKYLAFITGLYLLAMGLSLDMAWPAVIGLTVTAGALWWVVREPRWDSR